MKPKLVLIGNGMAGTRLLEEIVESCPQHYEVSVFGNEPTVGYNRIMLSPVLAGEKKIDDILSCEQYWYRTHNISLFHGPEHEVVRIDRRNKYVEARNGLRVHYDRLILATGSKPLILPVPGNTMQGVMSFRDISDVDKMIEASRNHSKAVVIGAGLLGLEAAMGLLRRGMAVTVIHRAESLLNRQLDEEGAELLQQQLENQGLRFQLACESKAIHGNNGRVSQLELQDGRKIDTELVVMAIGIEPNIALAQACGLHAERGIVVNDTMQTFDPSIYALGECVQHRGETFGLVAPLYDQAKVLTNHLSEHGVARYQYLPEATKLKVTGTHVYSAGDFLGDEGTEFLFFRHKARGIYKKLVIRRGKLVGAVLIGDIADGAFYSELIEQQRDVSTIRPYLVFGKGLCESQVHVNAPTADREAA